MPRTSEQPTADLATYQVGRLWHSELTGIDLIPEPGNRHWEIVLSQPLVVGFDDELHVVGQGFRFDGASIRYRAVNAIIQRYGREILPAAALHDWFYSDGRHLIPADAKDRRLWCDDLLYRAWRASGVNLVRAMSGYKAVRLFGGHVWQAGEGAGFSNPSVTKQTLLMQQGVRDYAREVRA